MGWRKKLPLEEQERLKRVGQELLPLFLDGVTARDLEERYHLEAGMAQALRGAGYRPGMRRRPQKRRMNPSPKRDRAEARRAGDGRTLRVGATLEEIGEASGVTRERVRQLIGVTGQGTSVELIRSEYCGLREPQEILPRVGTLRNGSKKVERCWSGNRTLACSQPIVGTA